MKAYITVGVSCSGKSTLAREMCRHQPNLREVNRDQMRWSIMKDKGLNPSWKNWRWKWEKEVTPSIMGTLAMYALGGYDIICSDTNLNPDHRAKLQEYLERLGYEVEILECEVTFEEACRRDAEREHGVGYSTIAKQWERWCEYRSTQVAVKSNLPCCIIVDIDGTVAQMGDRGPYEWDKVQRDTLKKPVAEIVKAMAAQYGYKIIFFSGRDGSCKEATEDWLMQHFGPDINFDVYMRAAGDMRKDSIIKRELYDQYVDGKYNPILVLDDRPSVCRMWREMGLEVLQVGNPYVEF